MTVPVTPSCLSNWWSGDSRITNEGCSLCAVLDLWGVQANLMWPVVESMKKDQSCTVNKS